MKQASTYAHLLLNKKTLKNFNMHKVQGGTGITVEITVTLTAFAIGYTISYYTGYCPNEGTLIERATEMASSTCPKK